MTLHFLLPDFLPPLRKIGANLLQGLELPSLAKLTARGRLSSEPAESAEGWLLRQFGFPAGDLPSAPYCLLAEGIAPGDAYWLHADPIHLVLHRTGMSIADASQFEVAQDEADAMVATLNSHFAADGLEFSAPSPRRWYGKSAQALPPARPLATVRGGAAEHAPGDGSRWPRVVSEIQMLLHAHPVNATRESRGALPINSLWPWGGGRLETPPANPFGAVFSDSLLASGLHLATGGHPMPPSLNTVLSTTGTTLMTEESLRLPAAYGDFAGWREGLAALEIRWFAPLLQGLEQNRISVLALHFPESGLRLDIRRTDLWKAWRRTPLTSLIE